MLDNRQKRIDDIEYEYNQYNARKSMKVMVRLTKMFVEPGAHFMGILGKGNSLLETDVDTDALAKAAKTLMERMDEDRVIDMIQDLVKQMRYDSGKPIVFDSHFRGKLDHLFRVVYFALESEYGYFFGESGLAGWLQGFVEKTKETQAAMTTQTSNPNSGLSSVKV